jgi:hypothetical protein
MGVLFKPWDKHYRVTFTNLIDYIKQLDDIVVLLSLILLILVTLTPVANVAFHQQKNIKSFRFL